VITDTEQPLAARVAKLTPEPRQTWSGFLAVVAEAEFFRGLAVRKGRTS
jgi:hypothetical protein